MALVGVLARVRVSERERIEEDLSCLEGVSTFRIPEDERIGILIETPSLDDAHALLTGTIDRVDGVLGTWPIFGHTGWEDDSPPGESESVDGKLVDGKLVDGRSVDGGTVVFEELR